MAQPATLEERLRMIRDRRTASRLSGATTLALWLGGSTALLTVAVATLLTSS
jgi:hypothetical protein